MTFFKTLTSLIIISLLLVGNSISDSHDNEQNIIEKAKEINKKVKKEQALQSAEEPLPLNDPFVGDASMSGRTEVTLLENNQNKDGTVSIPNVLKKYMNNLDKI